MSVNGQGKKLVENTDYTVSYSWLTIRSKKLKTIGKGELQNLNAKANFQAPKSKIKLYQKKLKGKGQKKTVKLIAFKK